MDETASTFTPSNHTLLIIDDEPDICELLEFKLKNEGYQTFSTTNPLEAVSKARDVSPDLIVLDVMMPELDGFRLCSMLKVDSKLNIEKMAVH